MARFGMAFGRRQMTNCSAVLAPMFISLLRSTVEDFMSAPGTFQPNVRHPMTSAVRIESDSLEVCFVGRV